MQKGMRSGKVWIIAPWRISNWAQICIWFFSLHKMFFDKLKVQLKTSRGSLSPLWARFPVRTILQSRGKHPITWFTKRGIYMKIWQFSSLIWAQITSHCWSQPGTLAYMDPSLRNAKGNVKFHELQCFWIMCPFCTGIHNFLVPSNLFGTVASCCNWHNRA